VIRKLVILAALALLVGPAAATAGPGKGKGASQASETAQGPSLPNPSRTCTSLRTSLGADIFKAQYATFGKCVTKNTRAQSSTVASAQAACRAEKADTNFAASHDGKSFNEYYGKNDNDANAFGKCVSQKAKASWTSQVQTTLKAAKACWADRKGDLAAFKSQWKNFGACVSSKAKSC
jgi:hypothetical protein